MWTFVWAVVVLLAGCLSPVMTFGAGKTAPQAQHDTLVTFTPGRLSYEKQWTGPVMDAKIRVYADDEYRTQNHKWREGFDDHLDYVNAVLAAKFGVRLVPDYREWKRHAPGATLSDGLESLAQLDDGKGVLAVVGLTSSLTLASATFEQLGSAMLSGRHMMVRGYADLVERETYTKAFPDLASDERENALETLRRHKMASVILHELGHNLGAEHDANADTLMSATYSRNATGFSRDSHAVIQKTLDERLGRAHTEIERTASEPAKARSKLELVVTPDGVIVGGRRRDDTELNILFNAQATVDSDTDVVITLRDGVDRKIASDLAARINAAGMKNVRIESASQ